MGTKRATFLSVAAGKEEERKIYFRQQFARNCRRLLPPTQKILHHSKNSKHSSLLCNKENFPVKPTFLISRKMRRFSTASEVKGTMYMNTRYIQVTYTEMYLKKKRGISLMLIYGTWQEHHISQLYVLQVPLFGLKFVAKSSFWSTITSL